jgi:hypothetical protein
MTPSQLACWLRGRADMTEMAVGASPPEIANDLLMVAENLRDAAARIEAQGAEIARLFGRMDQMIDALKHCDEALERAWPHLGGDDANEIAACQDHVSFVLNVHTALKGEET